MNLIVDFISVTNFSIVNIIANYSGTTTHAVACQLYNWNTTAWDTFNAMQTHVNDLTTASGKILDNYDFFIPNTTNYIGTSGDAGKVRVRFYHTMSGSTGHSVDIDVVALY